MSKNTKIADLINYISVDESGNVVLSTGGQVATQSYVTTAVSNLVNSAPSTLDTLNELAAALGNDANFATSVTNSIATKLPLSGGTLTGALNGISATFSGTILTDNNYKISNGLTLFGNHISTQWYNGADTVFVNYIGYNGGTTQFRNFHIYDGKQSVVAMFDGSAKSFTLSGNLSVNNGANTAVSLNGSAFVGVEYSRASNIYGYVGTENSASGGMRYNSVNGNYEHNFYTNSNLLLKLSTGQVRVIGVGNTLAFDTLDSGASTVMGTIESYGFRISNNRGNSTYLTLGPYDISFQTSGTTKVNISSSGLLTKPYQTAFSVRNLASFTINADAKLPLDGEYFDIGGVWNSSTYRFTAPVAGYYLFTFEGSFQSNGAHTYHAVYIVKNGGGTSFRYRGPSNLPSGNWFGISGSNVLYLVAGDYIELFGYTDSSSITAQPYESNFCGYLLG